MLIDEDPFHKHLSWEWTFKQHGHIDPDVHIDIDYQEMSFSISKRNYVCNQSSNEDEIMRSEKLW